MSLWIESHVELGSHKKLYKLCGMLKIEPVEAVGHLHYLWWWTMQNRPDGDLVGLFPSDIARAARWELNPKTFIEALDQCGWTQNSRIKDWGDYAGTLLKARERKKKWREEHTKERSQNVLGTGLEQLTEPNRTEPNRTVRTKNQEKDGFLSQKDEEIILKDIAKTNGVDPKSESAKVRLAEIIGEVAKVKDVKNPIALARHKALRQ